MKMTPDHQNGVGWRVLLLAALLTTASACAVEVREPVHEAAYYGDGDGYYVDAPPEPRTEVIVGPAPGPDYVWVGGYWGRYQNHWHWIGGRWAQRPHPHAHWQAGHWDHSPRGYHYHPGHWH